MATAKKREGNSNYAAFKENDKTERDTQSETIITPNIPLVPELAAVFDGKT